MKDKIINTEETQGKMEIGFAPGIVVIDLRSTDGRGIMTSIHSEEDARELVKTLERCITLAFMGSMH